MITPIIFNPIENNPYFWWNGLEIPIQLKWLFEQVLRHEKTIEELVEAVNKLNEEIETTIKDEVVAKINEMYKSGELRELIEEVSQDFFDDLQDEQHEFEGEVNTKIDNFVNSPKTVQNLDFRRLWRRCYRVGKNDRLSNPGKRPSGLQSGTKFTYNNADYIAVCLYGGSIGEITIDGTTYYGNDDDAVLQLFAMDNDAYTLAGQIRFRGGHVDCMDYNDKDGYFYIGPKNYSGVSTSDILRIHISNVYGRNLNISNFLMLPNSNETLQFVEKMQIAIPDTTPWSNSSGIGSVTCGTCNANEFIAGQYCKLYKFTWDESTPTETVVTQDLMFEIENERLTNEHTALRNPSYANVSATTEYLYFALTEPNIIIRANRETQKIDWVYTLPLLLNFEEYVLGELEGLKVFDNGDCFIFSVNNMCQGGGNITTSGDVTSIVQLEMGQCFYQNLVTNKGIPCGISTYHTNSRYVHVDSTTNVPNPTGYANAPFNNILEAVDYAQSQRQFNEITIALHNASNPYFVYISTDKTIYIQGTGLTETPTIGGMYVWGGNVVISNVTFWYSLKYPLASHPAYCSIYGATVRLQGCLFESNAGVSVPTACYVSNAICAMSAIASLNPPADVNTYAKASEWETTSDWHFLTAYNSICTTGGKAGYTGPNVLN